MTSQDTARTARIEARIAPDALAVVKRAAELQGRSISDFVVAAAHEAAIRTITDAEIVRLSAADQRLFAEALLAPPAPNEVLRRAVALHAESVEIR